MHIGTLHQKGADGINQARRLRNYTLTMSPGMQIHVNYQKIDTKNAGSPPISADVTERTTRIPSGFFNFHKDYIFPWMFRHGEREVEQQNVLHFHVRTERWIKQ